MTNFVAKYGVLILFLPFVRDLDVFYQVIVPLLGKFWILKFDFCNLFRNL